MLFQEEFPPHSYVIIGQSSNNNYVISYEQSTNILKLPDGKYQYTKSSDTLMNFLRYGLPSIIGLAAYILVLLVRRRDD
jgi:hypothetical protein